MFPFLYAVMVYAEAAISGTSTNPARSLGPAIISGAWQGWWIYWVGPVIGTLAAILACSFLAKRIEVAKLYHFESDRRRLFHTRRSMTCDVLGQEPQQRVRTSAPRPTSLDLGPIADSAGRHSAAASSHAFAISHVE